MRFKDIILDMDKIAVIIPCYNEEISIGGVVSDAKKYLPEAKIYVYDNNSTDKTVEKALEAGATVRYEKKQGKGNVIRTMFSEIDAECYLIVDGDDTYDLKNAREMTRRVLEDKDDMVIGDRLHGNYYKENKRAFHNFGNNLVRDFVNLLFHAKNPDIMTGLRAFSYAFVKSFPSKANGFETETEMSIFAATNKLKISSIVIEYRDRQKGSVSKLNTVKDGFKIINLIFRLFIKHFPLVIFGILFLLFMALGLSFGIPAIINSVNDVNNTNVVALTLCSLSILISMVALIFGFILNHKNKQNSLKEKETINKKREELEAKLNS